MLREIKKCLTIFILANSYDNSVDNIAFNYVDINKNQEMKIACPETKTKANQPG